MAAATPSTFPPDHTAEAEPSAYERMFKALMSGKAESFSEEQRRSAEETRGDLGEALEPDEYYTPGYMDPRDPDRTPSERKFMEVRPHEPLVAE